MTIQLVSCCLSRPDPEPSPTPQPQPHAPRPNHQPQPQPSAPAQTATATPTPTSRLTPRPSPDHGPYQVSDSCWGGAPSDAAHALEPRALLHGEALGAARQHVHTKAPRWHICGRAASVHLRLQPPLPTAAASAAHGCSLRCPRLQLASPTVAACITYGCSLHHLRLQALLADWAVARLDELLGVLELWMPRVQEGAFLANLLEQARWLSPPPTCVRPTHAHRVHARTHTSTYASTHARAHVAHAHVHAHVRIGRHTHTPTRTHTPTLEQACGCAASLGGTGLDFSPLLAAPFRSAVLRALDDGLAASLEHWQQAIAAQPCPCPGPRPSLSPSPKPQPQPRRLYPWPQLHRRPSQRSAGRRRRQRPRRTNRRRPLRRRQRQRRRRRRRQRPPPRAAWSLPRRASLQSRLRSRCSRTPSSLF